MSRPVLIDGRRVAAVSARDRGLQFGDGVFETMAVVDGRIRLLSRHLERLHHGARLLAIDLPGMRALRDELAGVAGDWGHGVIKLVVTRGSGSRGYAPTPHARPRRIVYAGAWPSLPSALSLRVCSTRLAIGGSLAGVKHLNRLEQVMVRLEWQTDDDTHDGLMLDANDNVVETTNANLFIVDDGRLITPPLTECGVAGVMRSFVMELAAQQGIETLQGKLRLEQVHAADEVFATNALAGITPVARLEATVWRDTRVTALLRERLDAAFQAGA